MHPLLQQLLLILYPLKPPNKTRTVPVEVLALGISRSGTDSLRQALYTLGYKNVYHGFSYGESPNDSYQFIRLGYLQENHPELLKREELDKVLGDCDAITDIPAAGFKDELLTAFPTAKVIVNYREDVDAWARSTEGTIEKIASVSTWPVLAEWVEGFFQPNLFWRWRSYWWTWSRYFGGDFRNKGKTWYRRHYRELEERLQREGRVYLKWKVEDGWEPLCELLGKEVPEGVPFPSGNVPAKFFERVAEMKMGMRAEARRNMKFVGIVVGTIGVAVGSWLCFR